MNLAEVKVLGTCLGHRTVPSSRRRGTDNKQTNHIKEYKRGAVVHTEAGDHQLEVSMVYISEILSPKFNIQDSHSEEESFLH